MRKYFPEVSIQLPFISHWLYPKAVTGTGPGITKLSLDCLRFTLGSHEGDCPGTQHQDLPARKMHTLTQ